VVVIVGGGAAGASTAIGLARRRLTPIVIEAERGPAFKIGECLPPNANPLLEMLGIKEKLSEAHLPSYGNRAAWGAPTPFERNFLFSPDGSGWHLDRLKFEALLAATAREAGADWRYGWRLSGCYRNKSGWSLTARNSSDEAQLEADFIVDATGRSRRIARQLGVQHIQYDRLIGTAVLLKSQNQTPYKDSFTLVEAVESGWWYSALLPCGGLMVIYMTDSDLIDHAALQRKEEWLRLLKQASLTLQRVEEGGYLPATEPQIYPAGSARLGQITGERWLAVGDAAAAYDPLSSYGISAAIGGGFHAASAIADFLLGGTNALSSYSAVIDQAYARYLMMNYGYYGLERRWPDKPFWQRRHQPEIQSKIYAPRST
jgi:flavin-dependent dehydrogenase